MYWIIYILFFITALTGCQQKDSNVFNGYVDADLIYLSADFSGRLEKLAVHRGQNITDQQFIFNLEEKSEWYNVGISQYSTEDLERQRLEILSELNFSQIQLHRAQVMRKTNATSQETVDASIKNLEVLKQQLAAIDAKIKSSHINTDENLWRVQQKKGYAPGTGIVFDVYYFKGEYVPAGNPVVSLIMPDKIKVVFFIPEKELAKVHLNQKIQISADSASKFALAHISYISEIAEYTPPIIYSREERQRLVFRIEASIDAPNLEKIHLGQPVSVKL